MHFSEQDHGDFRVYGGALDGRDGTYRAAVVVVRLRGYRNQPEIVFRDEHIAAGFAFATADAALKRAMEAGRAVIRSRFETPDATAAPAEAPPQRWPFNGVAWMS